MGLALFTDLYELTMAQSYLEHHKTGNAVFGLFARNLPQERNFLVTCGLRMLVDYLREFRFTHVDIEYLQSLSKFSDEFLEYLRNYRFRGKLYAMPEGRIAFQNEPLIQVEGILPEVQILETIVINCMHFQTMIASKAARTFLVSRGRTLVDFGLRRSHMPTAGIFAARAAYIAGFNGTSDLEAGRRFGIPVFGTMAHSFVMVFPNEASAFRAFSQTFHTGAVLLIDTYNTIECARIVAKLAEEGLAVAGVQIDSGDIPVQVLAVRKILDDAGLKHVKIFISSGVDEYAIDAWMKADLRVDAFGVGTHFTTSSDAPYLDMAYKLMEYEGQPKFKTSPGKISFPFKRQVNRIYRKGLMYHDEVIPMGEKGPGDSIVSLVMENGELTASLPNMAQMRENFLQDLKTLPPGLRGLEKNNYPVLIK